MSISDSLAYEIYIIELFHLVAILITVGFTSYLYFKTRKSHLFNSFGLVIFMLTLWMVSKILKTVAPTESLRWVFIVTQYFGVQFSGYAVIVFAYSYRYDRPLSQKAHVLLAVLPFFSFLAVATNPLHHLFYSYYDFYRDSFGPLFFPIQIVLYLYLTIGFFILSKRFTYQPHFKDRLLLGRLFAVIVLIPVLCNVYYLLVKLTDIPFIFNFPFFDFTPITSALALILFVMPAYRFRFLNLLPMAYHQIYNSIPQGIVLVKRGSICNYNQAFAIQFPVGTSTSLRHFAKGLTYQHQDDMESFMSFLTKETPPGISYLLHLKDEKHYRVNKNLIKRNIFLLRFTDVSTMTSMNSALKENNRSLLEANLQLNQMAAIQKELSYTKTHTQVAQTVHDILGHSMTVVIGMADLAARDKDLITYKNRCLQIQTLLESSLSDVKNALTNNALQRDTTSLIQAIQALKNDTIVLDFIVQGIPHELSSQLTEAIFRTCQECMTNAINHGNAKNLLITLRFKSEEIELYIIDDGIGCKIITPNYGLKGIHTRVMAAGGTVHFGSDGQKGFHIHIKIPK